MQQTLKQAAVVVVLSLSAVAFAQADEGVDVEVNSGGKSVKVNTGAGGVSVKTNKKDVSVKTGPGGVEVKTGKKTVTVGGAAVDTGGAAVNVAAPDEDDDGDDDVADDGSFVITGAGAQHTHACTQGQEVTVSGSSNTVALTGPCGDITLSGTKNRLSADIAGSLTVSGVGNQATWKQALTGKKPKVSKSGLKNTVSQAK